MLLLIIIKLSYVYLRHVLLENIMQRIIYMKLLRSKNNPFFVTLIIICFE